MHSRPEAAAIQDELRWFMKNGSVGAGEGKYTVPNISLVRKQLTEVVRSLLQVCACYSSFLGSSYMLKTIEGYLEWITMHIQRTCLLSLKRFIIDC